MSICCFYIMSYELSKMIESIILIIAKQSIFNIFFVEKYD